jgi:hypothetical protein
MNKFGLKFAAVLAAILLPLLAHAADDALPAEVRGHWCEYQKLGESEMVYRRAVHCSPKRLLVVRAGEWNDGDVARCTIISVDRTVTSRCVLSTDPPEKVLNHSSFRRRGALLVVRFDEP